LINRAGERFMVRIHPLAELAPRDVVARGVHAEIVAGRGAYLDCRTAIGARFAEAFPTVYGYCRQAGIDPAMAPIPVAPAAHFHMGGVAADANGRTSLEGLWACGEAASTGAHGANRLASNSLLEAIVFGGRVAEDIAARLPAPTRMRPAAVADASLAAEADGDDVRRLRHTMSSLVGVIRDRDGLRAALASIAGLAARPDLALHFRNMLAAAQLVAAAALARTESRGGHYRSDFPDSDPAWRHRTLITLADAEAIAAGGGSRAAADSRPAFA
jgi:L-aspartate oxidase